MSRRSTRVLLASALLLAACGGASHHAAGSHHVKPVPVKVVRPARAVWCPTTMSTLRQSKPNAPTSRSFDTRSLLGQTERQASLSVQRLGCVWRVVERDGRHFALTADINLHRVDVAITHGRVTSVGVY